MTNKKDVDNLINDIGLVDDNFVGDTFKEVPTTKENKGKKGNKNIDEQTNTYDFSSIPFVKEDFKLILGDCFKELELLDDKSIDLVVTDPPYEHVQGGMKSKKFNTGTWKKGSYMTEEMSSFKRDDIFKWLDIIIPKMKKVNMYIFCSKLQLRHYFEYLALHKKLKFDLLVWDKSSENDTYSMKNTKFYAQDIEYIVRIYESGVSLNKVWNDDHTKADISYYMKRKKFKQPRGVHNTMKPVEMLEQFIELSSNKGDTVLDCFMGSGSTGVACRLLERKFIGIEVNKEYYDLANNRILGE